MAATGKDAVWKKTASASRLPSPYAKSSLLPYCSGYVYGSKSVSTNPSLGSPYTESVEVNTYLLVRPANASQAALASFGE
ncbi:hypothetical protein D3C74_485930 [compost metagenome]